MFASKKLALITVFFLIPTSLLTEPRQPDTQSPLHELLILPSTPAQAEPDTTAPVSAQPNSLDSKAIGIAVVILSYVICANIASLQSE